MTSEVRCGHCDAVTPAGRPCWLCHQPTTDAVPVDVNENPYTAALVDGPPMNASTDWASPYRPPAPIGQTAIANRFTWVLLAGLILVIVVLAVAAPGLAVAVAIVAAPALLRTAIVVLSRRRRGIELSRSEKSLMFFASTAGVLVALIATGGAFFIACVAVCFGAIAMESTGSAGGWSLDALIYIAIIFSGLVGLGTLFLLWKR